MTPCHVYTVGFKFTYCNGRVLPTVVTDGRARPALELNDQDLQAHDHYSNYRDLANLLKYKSTKRS